jgi:hypothetical protein
MRKTKVMVLVAGWCPPTVVDEKHNTLAIDTAYAWIDEMYHGAKVTVVSGLCDVGVMSYAYAVAGEEWRKIGVACKKAENFKHFPVDEKYLIGNDWGDESETFTNFCLNHKGPKVFINVAGGKQANREEETCRESGATIFHFALDRK